MRFIIMHKTNPQWEAGAVPSPELIARVGAMLGELSKANVLLGGEGLRATSLGARVRISNGKRTVKRGPFAGENELPAAFSIVHAPSLDDAIERALGEAGDASDIEIDVRPLTEPWDIGMMPKPEGLTTQRFMLLRKANKDSEAGAAKLNGVAMRPSARGRRFKNTDNGVRVTDGPFAETKELLAGFVIVSVDSLEDASRLALRYLDVVESDEVDVRELEDAPS